MNAPSLATEISGVSPGNGPMLPLPGHVDVAGVPVFDAAAEHVLSLCHERIAAGVGTRIATANLDFLAIARRDATLKEHLRSSHLVLADGKPVAVLARVAGAAKTVRVAGVDLVGSLLARHPLPTLRVALYGATEHVSLAAADTFAAYDRVEVVARVVPPFRPLAPDEELEERARIREAEPHLVLVALGCPRQEQLIARYFDEAPGATWIGVGGTLDFFAGSRKRAPRWVQDAGGEWIVRLAQEPRRLWRRYLLRDVPALAAVAPPVCGAAVRRRFRS
ncbi:MAG: WecB/TagA/CpsF family glycosyltransferase [Dehalococcoidia bacterium]|nr:WecB/TagA/CpsF family glycosyltransferase [Dehalococcoidia bacterium]